MRKFFREIWPFVLLQAWLSIGVMLWKWNIFVSVLWFLVPFSLTGLAMQMKEQQEVDEFVRTHPVIVGGPPEMPPAYHPPHVHVHHLDLPH